MSIRDVIEHVLRVYYADSAEPNAIARDVLAQYDAEREPEYAAVRALQLGDLDGRVSATCDKENHPTWLRKADDTRACPWCVMDLQSDSLVARTHQLAHYERIERERAANQRVDGSLAAVANRRIAELTRERDALNARAATLEAELRIGPPWKCPTCSKDNTRDVCVICETDRPDPPEQTEATSYPPALPWARLMDDEDLSDFLDDLVAAAGTPGSYEGALATVETAIATHRLIAEAQHAHNTAPGPDAVGGAS